VSANVEEARQQIRAAFAEVAHPGEGTIGHCGRCHHEADVQIVEAVEGWPALSTSALHGLSLAFFSPEGFRFVLPALMLHVLTVWNSDDPAVDSTVWGLGPAVLWDRAATENEGPLPEGQSPAEATAVWYSKVRVLTTEQRGAVMSFLGALAALAESDEYLREDAQKALNWWKTWTPDEPAA